jgi:AcrR family transcriptional regulator
MTAPIKTRERILQASLELFNVQGERSVSTNHLAAHLGISPGNLYYHFRNKQAIIAELFADYARRVDGLLRLPAERVLTVADKTVYLEALLAAMWSHRFLHRDLEHLLESDATLAAGYRLFARRCLEQAQAVYQGFVEVGILQMTPAEVEALSLNSWIIMTSWVRFLCTLRGDPGDLSPAMLQRGIYQVLTLESAYTTAPYRVAVQALQQRLHVPMEQVLGPLAG